MAIRMSRCVLLWFRADLRLSDNHALRAAEATRLPVIPVFIGAPEEGVPWPPGAASRWWLHQSLGALDRSLRDKGSRLIVRRGPTEETLLSLVRETGARRIFCNRVYEPGTMVRASKLENTLRAAGIALESFQGNLLFEPSSIRTTTGGSFRVFTPFWRALWKARDSLASPSQAPTGLRGPHRWPKSLKIAELGLEPKIDWAAGLRTTWNPGEETARRRLRWFGRGAVSGYGNERDRTDREGTSRLSPHLHFGEVSPLQVWHAIANAPGAESCLRQLAWREFAYHLLVEHPQTVTEPFHEEFREFPWRANRRRLKAWQRGRTGYPFVDAGMRELWATGWMHNRARLVVASFLVKHLLVPWQDGARWFLDTLVDADLANNTLGWQWVAGCGVDAAPYFRIFNPVLQGRKFDPDGAYVRRWVPELKGLSARWIHEPWAAPREALMAAGATLGKTYPLPLVRHAEARAAALAAFKVMKEARR